MYAGVCIHLNVYISMHLDIEVYPHLHTYSPIPSYLVVCTSTNLHNYIFTYHFTYCSVCLDICIPIYVHAHIPYTMSICSIPAYIYIYTYTYISEHTRICTNMCVCTPE